MIEAALADASTFAAFGVFTALAAAELVWGKHCSPELVGRRWFGNLGLYLLCGGVLMVPKLLAISTALAADDLDFGLLNWLAPPPIVHALLALLALDAISYAIHRLSHSLSVLW